MRLKICIALVATAMVMYACDWFATKPVKSNFTIAGSWKLDSISPVIDSSPLPLLVALHGIDNDSGFIKYEFRDDTMYAGFSNQEVMASHFIFEENTGQLKVLEDSTEKVFTVLHQGDSLVNLTNSDSITMFLRRL